MKVTADDRSIADCAPPRAAPGSRAPASLRRLALPSLLIAALLANAACGKARSAAVIPPPAPQSIRTPPTTVARDAINPRLLRRFRPIARLASDEAPPSAALVSLGRTLWYDPRLSRSGDISCNSCHDLNQAGVDHRSTSIGDRGLRGRRNAPTVYNSAGHIAEFWDGRAKDLEAQAGGPILNPSEMASTRGAVEATLASLPDYQPAFARAFPGAPAPMTFANVAKALAAFERGLVTRSRWDAFLAGDRQALTPGEIRGLHVFLQVGCVGCHTGPQVGASMFRVAGFVEPWPNQRDQGRFEVTGAGRDHMVFKVPTMKNVARTAPYFHDGSCESLPQAIRLMGKHQLGLELADDQVSSIASFLMALSGEPQRDYIARPVLPGLAVAEGGGGP